MKNIGNIEAPEKVVGFAAPLAVIAVFSVAVNLLMLTGPLYMLQVYDRVLGSRSEETLVTLSVLALGLFAGMGVLDAARGRVAARIGTRMQDAMQDRVFTAGLARARKGDPVPNALRDLDAVGRLSASPALMAVFDLPWTPVFVLAIFVFHPALGWLALGGGALLVLVSLANQSRTRRPLAEADLATAQAARLAAELVAEAGAIRALGMEGAAQGRWRSVRLAALEQGLCASDRGGGYAALTRVLRLGLQSAMLGLGAFLVIRGQVTPGAMIACAILLGRALAPVELAIGHWPLIARAQAGWKRLRQLLASTPAERACLALPRPAARLDLHKVSVVPPEGSQATLRELSLTLAPGQALGVIGPSGAGKTTLARALTGQWGLSAGQIRLGGASLDQYGPGDLGAFIGYLPQRVTLLSGTIAQNIARLAEDADPRAVIAAARQADAHEMILSLPAGYDTTVAQGGAPLSGGQVQRIGLARALYGDPVLLVLDEPDAHLDHAGSDAVAGAVRKIRARGGAAVVMAHRPAAIATCDTLLVLDGGRVRRIGPREEVLREMVQNHVQIAGVA